MPAFPRHTLYLALSVSLALGSAGVAHAAGQAAAPSVTELDKVQVQGRAQTLYRVDDSAVATRTDTPLERVPQSVQVIPRELMDDQAARQVTDLYRSISGISVFSYAGVTLRGFRQENVLYDGLRGDPYAGFSVPQLFNIERVEVLKGPAGALYGGGDAGGVVNYVTRKPRAVAERRIELQVGNEDFRAASIEATGPLTASGKVRYRAGLYADTEKGVRWNADSDSVVGDVSVAFDVGDTGELTLQYTDITQKLGGNLLRGVPVNNQGTFLTDRRWNANEADDYLDMDGKVVTAQYRFAPTSALDVDVGARWFEKNEYQIYHESTGLIDRDRDGTAEWMTRELRDHVRTGDAVSANANAVWRVATGAIEHKVLFGADVYQVDAATRTQRAASADLATNAGPVPGIDLFRPVYGLTSYRDIDWSALPASFTDTRSQRYGAYLQDEIALTPRWHVLAGLRWDGFKDDDRLANSEVDGHDLSWRLGSTYTVSEGVNLYASLASGFQPQNAFNQNPATGGPFDAERSRQWEVGMKSLLADRVTLNVAAYHIERSNIVQATGERRNGFDQLATLGLVRSRGAEVDLLADLTERWVLNVAYAYNDAEVKDAGVFGISNSVGTRFANAPRNKLGLWTRYDFPAIESAVGFGFDHVGERVSLSNQTIKAYTVFDLSWKTDWQQWQFQANVKNLFDKVYAASGFITRNGHFPGEPRRLYLQAAYTF